MHSISLCMIVKNEENCIGRCLESVKGIVEEIIIVDTGSIDRTKQIARNYTDQIFDFKWTDHFSEARNHSFSLAAMDYILWLDADDVITETNREKLLQLKHSLELSVDAVSMLYDLSHDKNGNAITSIRRNRLVKRAKNYQWEGAVHEYLNISGNILRSNITIKHNSIKSVSGRNLGIYEKRLSRGDIFSPRDLFYYANELRDHGKFTEAIHEFKSFLATKAGWTEDNISACSSLADCYYELGDMDAERNYLLKSFEYDSPRAEFCCRLGYQLLEENQPKRAAFWYKLATQLEIPKTTGGLIHHPCWTWLPHMHLCICYIQLEEYKLAYKHNELAYSYQPEHPIILHNKDYLKSIQNQEHLFEKTDTTEADVKTIDHSFQKKQGKKRLRITYIMDHVNVCGGVRVLLEQIKLLSNKGHTIFIICPDSKPDWFALPASIAYIQLPPGAKRKEYIPETDVIVTTYAGQIIECCNTKKAPILHFEQGGEMIFEFERFSPKVKALLMRQWSSQVAILSISKKLAARIRTHFNRTSQVLPIAIDHSLFSPRKGSCPLSHPPRILFVGPEQWSFKGIADIFAALTILQNAGHSVEPVWITQLPPVTEFHGTAYINPDQERLGEVFRSCDIYVCASHYEAFGLPAIEAMASGCAVVTTDHDGVYEYAVHEKNCLIAPANDPARLAQAIQRILKNDQLRSSLVEEGLKTAAKFLWEETIKQLEQFLYGAINALSHC